MSGEQTWRQSTRREIQNYYETVFPTVTDKIPDWVIPPGPNQYAIAFRDHYPAQHPSRDIPDKNFIRRPTRNEDNPDNVYLGSWDRLIDFIQEPAGRDPMAVGTNRKLGLIHPDDSRVSRPAPAPAAVYYGLDHWDKYWVLAFDIDAKDIAKARIAADDQTFDEVSKEEVKAAELISQPPTPHTRSPDHSQPDSDPDNDDLTMEYPYEFQDIQQAINSAFDLRSWLLDTVGIEEVKVFYSGQGTHVYAFSEDNPYHQFTHQSRRFIVTYIQERLGIPVDGAVTWDKNRVIRLPQSLHTGVNRVVTEIHSPDFDFRTDPRPPESITSSTTPSSQ